MTIFTDNSTLKENSRKKTWKFKRRNSCKNITPINWEVI